MSCRHALLTLALVLTLSGCDEEARPLAPPLPGPPPGRAPAAAPAPAPTRLPERADVPWAPTRYAPALGLLARDGLKVDVDPATGRETLFEVDLELGGLALRRARTGGHDPVGLFGRGWRSELDARVERDGEALLVDRLQGRALFLPVEPGVWGSALGEEEVARQRPDGGWEVVDAAGRVWLFDAAGRLTGASPSLAIAREPGLLHVGVSETDWVTLVLDAAGRVVEARRGDERLARWTYAGAELASVDGPRVRAYVTGPGGVTAVDGAQGLRLLQVVRDPAGRLAALRAGGLEQRYLFDVDAQGAPSSARVDTPHGAWVYRLGTGAEWTIETPLGVERARFDARGRLVGHERAPGAASAPAIGPPPSPPATGAADEARPIEDAAGRVTAVDGPTGRTTYHRQGGHLTGVETPAGRRWRFERDAHGQLTRADGPMGELVLQRDAQGRVLSVADATGVVRSIERDALGRATCVSTLDGAEVVARAGPDGRGVVLASGERTLHVLEDDAGQLVVTRDDGLALVHDFEEGAEVVSTPWGLVRRETDELGRVARIESPAGTFRFEHDPAGRRARVVYPNGVTLVVARDAQGREASRVARGRAGEALRLDVTRDAAGRPAAIARNGTTTRFEHDAAGRLTRAGSTAWSLDADGHRLGVTRDGVTEVWSVDGRGRLVTAGSTRATHDAAGRLVALERPGGTDAFAWDGLGRLVHVARAGRSPVAYTYDPLGRLATRTVGEGTTRFVWEGDRLLAELGPGARERVYVFGPGLDEPLAVRDESGAWTFLVGDARSTVQAYVDGRGRVVDRARFTPFGELEVGPGGDRPVFYAGRLVDPVTGLVHLRARWLDPALGRFLSPDPAGLVGGLNAYAYVGHAPLERVDPLGLSEEERAAGEEEGLWSRAGRAFSGAVDTVVGAREGLGYLLGTRGTDEEQAAARAASARDIASGRARDRALGAFDGYAQHVTFGLVDPGASRFAGDAAEAARGASYGQAGGVAFDVASFVATGGPRLVATGLGKAASAVRTVPGVVRAARAAAPGALRAAPGALLDLARAAPGLVARGAAATKAAVTAAPGAVRDALAAVPGALRSALAATPAALRAARDVAVPFLRRQVVDSVANVLWRPFGELVRAVRSGQGVKLSLELTQGLNEARAAEAALAASTAAAREAAAAASVADDAARAGASSADDLAHAGADVATAPQAPQDGLAQLLDPDAPRGALARPAPAPAGSTPTSRAPPTTGTQWSRSSARELIDPSEGRLGLVNNKGKQFPGHAGDHIPLHGEDPAALAKRRTGKDKTTVYTMARHAEQDLREVLARHAAEVEVLPPGQQLSFRWEPTLTTRNGFNSLKGADATKVTFERVDVVLERLLDGTLHLVQFTPKLTP